MEPTIVKNDDIDRVLVIGASGNVGRELIPALLDGPFKN